MTPRPVVSGRKEILACDLGVWLWKWAPLWLQGVTPRPVVSGRKGIDAWDLGGAGGGGDGHVYVCRA